MFGAVSRLLPSSRSLAVGFGLVALAAGAYAVARESSMFAIETLEVTGASPATEAAVRKALAPLAGTSLLALGAADVERRTGALPSVVWTTYDRAFPHTLRVTVREERPVAVLRRGPDSFLVSARARILRPLEPRALLALPRIWVARSTGVEVGATLAGDAGAAVDALVPLSRLRLPVQVASAEATSGQLALRLRTGLELRLGTAQDLLLKLDVARRILPTLGLGSGAYLDVSVPDRPVSGTENPKVEG
jgi:cell division protein FtsQ